MKLFFAIILITTLAAIGLAQTEQAAITPKDLDYKDWTHPNLIGEGETNLRKFTEGKKLVMVVYWAPWCPNWRHDVAFVQELHEKYGKEGLAIIGVGEYDTVEKMRAHATQYALSFPLVYASVTHLDREKTVHYAQRKEAGDIRRWGTPWYIFLENGKVAPAGETLATKLDLVNGELIKNEAEAYIRGKLGLDAKSSAP
ncbi:MAG: TlpA family protein disulfide reductase [Blastocatellia bacterium]|nr:TlpA family protein disulfide reductase [Blastocatellia bacterium]